MRAGEQFKISKLRNYPIHLSIRSRPIFFDRKISYFFNYYSICKPISIIELISTNFKIFILCNNHFLLLQIYRTNVMRIFDVSSLYNNFIGNKKLFGNLRESKISLKNFAAFFLPSRAETPTFSVPPSSCGSTCISLATHTQQPRSSNDSDESVGKDLRYLCVNPISKVNGTET